VKHFGKEGLAFNQKKRYSSTAVRGKVQADEELLGMKKILPLYVLIMCMVLMSYRSFAQVSGDLYNAGVDKSIKGDYYGAISDFTKVIEQYPNEPKPYHYRGINKFNLKDYDGSIADFDKAIKLNPKFGDAYYYRGMAKVGAKKKKESCPDFQKASELGFQLAKSALDKYCR
jgi:tetratricopeptide (TPR) repeat protein